MKLSLDYNITERKKYKERGMMAWKISQHDRHVLCSNQKTSLAMHMHQKETGKQISSFSKASVFLYCNYNNHSVLTFISFYLKLNSIEYKHSSVPFLYLHIDF